MSEEALTPPFFLLGCFAEYYEEVANIKLAIAEGRLGAYLALPDETPPTQPVELASRVSGRLSNYLRQQAQTVNKNASEATCRAYGVAQYVMAALADEIFILETEWSGSALWLEVLMEYKLFSSRDAGRRFFELADRLLKTHQRTPQHIDLAAVMLLALQLGFKGLYRGEESEVTIQALREKLHRFVNAGRQTEDSAAFPQAYQNLVVGKKAARIAPLWPWYRAAGLAMTIYLLISSIVWLALLRPFNEEVEQAMQAARQRASNQLAAQSTKPICAQPPCGRNPH